MLAVILRNSTLFEQFVQNNINKADKKIKEIHWIMPFENVLFRIIFFTKQKN